MVGTNSRKWHTQLMVEDLIRDDKDGKKRKEDESLFRFITEHTVNK